MVSQEEIGNKIFSELMGVQEEFGDEIAFAFLAGIKFAVSLQSELFASVNAQEEEQDFSEIALNLGEFYSNISKGEIS
jgi:hypothetical protein